MSARYFPPFHVYVSVVCVHVYMCMCMCVSVYVKRPEADLGNPLQSLFYLILLRQGLSIKPKARQYSSGWLAPGMPLLAFSGWAHRWVVTMTRYLLGAWDSAPQTSCTIITLTLVLPPQP